MVNKYIIVKGNEKPKFSFSRFRRAAMWRLYHNPFQFVWNMVIYHGLILVSLFILGYNVPAKVAMPLGLDPVGGVSEGTAQYLSTITWQSGLFFTVILILDFWLLAIIKSELKPKEWDLNPDGSMKREWFTYKKIIYGEIIIFFIGIFNPYVRAAMLFFGANTIQVAIVKKWMIVKWKPSRLQFGDPAKYFFITGSYLLVIDLIRRIIFHFFFGIG